MITCAADCDLAPEFGSDFCEDHEHLDSSSYEGPYDTWSEMSGR